MWAKAMTSRSAKKSALRRRWDGTRTTWMTSVGSFWGHQGLFDSLAGDAPRPDQPPPSMPTTEVRRAPLQVMDGNYQRMRGVCPWWDFDRGPKRD